MPTQAWLGRQYDWMFMFISMWHACCEDVWEPNHDPNTLSTTAPLEAFGCPTWERETRRWSVGIARANARGGCASAASCARGGGAVTRDMEEPAQAAASSGGGGGASEDCSAPMCVAASPS